MIKSVYNLPFAQSLRRVERSTLGVAFGSRTSRRSSSLSGRRNQSCVKTRRQKDANVFCRRTSGVHVDSYSFVMSARYSSINEFDGAGAQIAWTTYVPFRHLKNRKTGEGVHILEEVHSCPDYQAPTVKTRCQDVR